MGDDLIKSFLHRFTSEKKLIKYVLNMTHLHMAPNIYARDHSSIKATNKLFDESVAPFDLILLSHADKLGQINDLEKVDNRPFLLDRLKKYEELMKEDEVTGSDLIELGLKPRSNYAKALEYAHNLHLSLVKKKEALPQVVRYFEELSNKKDRK